VSSRARTRLFVAAVAVAAASVAAVVAWAGREPDTPPPATAAGPREGVPPLALDALVADETEAAGIREGARLYEEGQRREALDAFRDVLAERPGSLYAAVGAAFALWPEGTLEELRALEAAHPESGLVQLHLGLALLWQGRRLEAEEAWRRAEALEPDSAAAIRAESLLHTEMPAGRPFFVPGTPLPEDLANRLPLEQLEQLGRRAESADTAEAWLHYGVALQRAGKPVSARDAFDRAVELAPADPEALVAAALARFDKDAPSQAFSRLGPLADRFPDEPVVRFHLGLSLLWLRQVDEAREQLDRAVAAGGDTIWGREAALLLDRLESAGS
jgi:tetratricopeptide (TPR) repeat protein